MTHLIEFQDVRKRYGKHEVLHGIDLSVPEGAVVSLIGASGSGKSTLLRCTNGLEAIQGGQILIDGDQVSGEGVDLVALRRKVGMVFQSFNLFPHMSVLQNCMVAPVNTGRASKSQAKEQALEMLHRVGLADQAGKYPDALSGGQQQRVAIARTMLMHPKVLLLDEITSALDPELVNEVLDLVRDLASAGMTMILTTHEMAFARETSSKVCFLSEGRILEQGTPDDIFGSPETPALKSFIGRLASAGRL